VERCHVVTIDDIPMMLRITDDEQEALREQARCEGISMQEAARRAVRQYVGRSGIELGSRPPRHGCGRRTPMHSTVSAGERRGGGPRVDTIATRLRALIDT
jgi:hypothetical protein